jgi:threonine synthase
MVGYQASGSAPFMRGGMVADPETLATAIRIGHPQSWDYAWSVSEESGGWFDELSDDDILAAQRTLASEEGVYCEPASAASLAGALRDIERGNIKEGSTVVCTLTGHGLKDPDIASRYTEEAVTTVDATNEAVRGAILGRLS